ncbi:MAG: phosphate:sodium symporter [Planctomycetaceae bacterium]|nr:phosphate:sodium symporter [Planctomycetaceae bacterium]
MELFYAAIVLLAATAVFDLTVGVSNDAVNFLNSSFGSRAGSRRVILIIASIGILVGVTFSGGMMEVARKGIFHPGYFTMPELIAVFLAVMLADVVLLDVFNTYGLPTSTTVSIVFELLGAATAMAMLKVSHMGENLRAAIDYINTGTAMVIIGGILLSVLVAFIFGALVQLCTRLLFTFDYESRLARFGSLWCGAAMAMITYFILVKGAKGASFITSERAEWIASHSAVILLGCFAVSAAVFQILQRMGVNILAIVVLVGTFALAMAFAANDLVNFVGVPMAGYHAFKEAGLHEQPLTATMDALAAKVPIETHFLLLAGAVMVVTLWLSRKAQTVTETEISLGRQNEGAERFESIYLARVIVRMAVNVSEAVAQITPPSIRARIARRLDVTHYHGMVDEESRPSFDLLRASVNLTVASAIISYATSNKLPLSTTYVTFMVAMGSSFADQAWGRESAVYRVTGVLTVIAGWFATALTAFILAAIFAVVLYFGGAYGAVAIVLLAAFIFWKNHHRHKQRVSSAEMAQVFHLKKVTDVEATLSTSFEHMAILLREIRDSIEKTLDGLAATNLLLLHQQKARSSHFQAWANIIIANIFKAMRLIQRGDGNTSSKYGQTVRRIQRIVDTHRDIVMRCYMHVSNQHKGLPDVQTDELRQVAALLFDLYGDVDRVLTGGGPVDLDAVQEKDRQIRDLADSLHDKQLERIREGDSKTRHSILWYAIIGNMLAQSKQNLRLLRIYSEVVGRVLGEDEFDME